MVLWCSTADKSQKAYLRLARFIIIIFRHELGVLHVREVYLEMDVAYNYIVQLRNSLQHTVSVCVFVCVFVCVCV